MKPNNYLNLQLKVVKRIGRKPYNHPKQQLKVATKTGEKPGNHPNKQLKVAEEVGEYKIYIKIIICRHKVKTKKK